MYQNIRRNPPLSSVYRADSSDPQELIWDLSDPRVNSKHFENAIPMALLYWTRDLARDINDLQRLKIRVPASRGNEAYCLFLQKNLIDSVRMIVDVIIDGVLQNAVAPVFPQSWRTTITAVSPTIEELHEIMAEANLPIPRGILFYQNVSDRNNRIVQGRIYGLKVLRINLNQRTVNVLVGDPTKGLGLGIVNWQTASHFTDSQLLQQISAERANPATTVLSLYTKQEEHYLESKILSMITTGGNMPEPWEFITGDNVFFQFPVKTALAGKARYIDILARNSDAPIVIEIKVAPKPGNESEYYFQAIGQAMSYAGYLKGALSAEPLENIPAQFRNVRPAIVFPDLRANHAYLQEFYVNLVGALNSKLNANNGLLFHTIQLGPWQQARAVQFALPQL